MSLSLNTSDPLYSHIVQCVMVDPSNSAVVDVANSGVSFTRNASGTTNVVSSGTYGDGWGIDGDGSFTCWGWAAAGIPASLGPAGVSLIPGNSTNPDLSIFVALNSFTSAANNAYFVDNGGSVQMTQVGVSGGKDVLYENAGTILGTGTQTLPTASAFTLLSTWVYNGGANGGNVYYNGSTTADLSVTAGPNGSGSTMANLGTTSGQGSLKCSVFALVLFDSILTGSDFQRLTTSLTGGGAFALISSSAPVTPGPVISNGKLLLSNGKPVISGLLPLGIPLGALSWIIGRRNRLFSDKS